MLTEDEARRQLSGYLESERMPTEGWEGVAAEGYGWYFFRPGVRGNLRVAVANSGSVRRYAPSVERAEDVLRELDGASGSA